MVYFDNLPNRVIVFLSGIIIFRIFPEFRIFEALRLFLK